MKQPTNIRLCALIPTYNNASTICDVVERVYVYLKDIIVVADGPTDDTLERLKQLSTPITLVHYEKNRGKGYALKTGFEKAIELGFTHALTIDSDGQHYPEDIPTLYRAYTLHPEAIIIGSRGLKQDNMPQKNTFANKFSNFWFALQTGKRLPDTQTGFRIYPLHLVRGVRCMTSRYEAELELLVFSAWAEVEIVPVPIRVYYPPKEERVSHFRPAYDFTRISILNTGLCVLALVYGLPRRWWRSLAYGLFFTLYVLFWLYPAMWLMILRYGKTPRMHACLHKFIKGCAHFLLKAIPGVRYRIAYEDGATYLHESEPAMLIANHCSMLDILALMSIHDKTAFVAKDWVSKNPLFGLLAQGFDLIPAKDGIEDILPLAQKKIAEGYSVVVFPEGTRSATGELGRFHRGAFYLAEQMHLPIRPVMIRGSYDLLHKTENHLGRVSCLSVHVMPEVTTDDVLFGTDYRERTRMFATYYREHLDCAAYPYPAKE